MIEPLSVGVNAVRRARMAPGDSVVVIGAGNKVKDALSFISVILINKMKFTVSFN